MKEGIKKFIAFNQMAILILTLVLTMLAGFKTESIAKEENPYAGMKVIMSIGYFKIYAYENDIYKGVIENSNGTLITDPGVTIKLAIDENNKEAKKLYDWQITKKARGTMCGREITFREDDYEDENFEMEIRVRTGSKSNTWSVKHTIPAKIRKNSFVLPKNDNAIMKDGVIYAKPGSTFKLATKYDNSAYSSRRGSLTRTDRNFQINGFDITTPDWIGEDGYIHWQNDYGVKVEPIKIITSNLASNDYTIKGVYNGSVSSGYGIQKNGYVIAKNFGVEYNRKIIIDVQPKQQFRIPVAAKNISISNASGFNILNGTPEIKYSNNVASISLNIKNAGILKFEYYDWNNEKHTNYWHFEQSDSKTVESHEQVIEDKIIPDDGNGGDAGTGNSGSSGGNHSSGSNSGSGSKYNGGESYSATSYIIPGYHVHSDWDDNQNVITFDIETEESERTGWWIEKRKNPNVRCNKWLFKEFYNLNGETKFSIDSREYEEGIYDVFLYTENGDRGYFNWIMDVTLGGKYAVYEPIIQKANNPVYNEETGSITYKYITQNCTELKYKVVKRDDPNTPTIDENNVPVYDGFDGKVSKDPNSIEFTIDPIKDGSGVYDIVVYGICRRADNGMANIYRSSLELGVPVYVDPLLKVEQEKNTNELQSFKVSASTVDNTKINNIYYAICKSGYSVNSHLNAEMIKNSDNNKIVANGKVDNNGSIELKYSDLGVGYYELYVYAENNLGAGKITRIGNIGLGTHTKIEYNVVGEEENAKSSITPRYVQYVDITPTDELLGSDNTVLCYVSEEKLEDENGNIDRSIFKQKSKYLNKSEYYNAKSGEKLRVPITAIAGEEAKDVYLYILAYPHGPNMSDETIVRTGSIRIDGTPLKLESIYVSENNNISNQKVFKQGDKLEVTAAFNHDIDNTLKYYTPSLVLNVGNKQLAPTSSRVSKNQMIYTYKLKEDTPNGNISIGSIEYNNVAAFSGKDAEEYVYNKDIKTDNEWKDLVGNSNYSIDTIKPQILETELRVTADESKIVTNNETNSNYVSDYDKVLLYVKYTEPVVGPAMGICLMKGNETSFIISEKNCNSDTYSSSKERIKDVYDITDLIKNDENIMFDGDISIKYFWDPYEKLKDIAGNSINIPENKEDIILLSVLNENRLNNGKIIFDSNVSEPQIYTGNKKVEDSEATYNTNTELTLFAEFNSNENYMDKVGLKDTVNLNIYYNNEYIPNNVYNKNNMQINENSYVIQNSDKSGYSKVIKYTVDTSLLPLKFRAENEGKYFIETIKTDKLNNKSSKELEITTQNKLVIDKDRKLMVYLNNNRMYCLNDLQQNEKKCSVFLRANEDMNLSGINVYIREGNDKIVELEYDGIVEYEGNQYVQCDFDIWRGGKYQIVVDSGDGENLLTDFIEIDNVYLIGDTDCNGKVTSSDVIPIMEYIVGLGGYDTNKMVKYAGNVDGSITSTGKPMLDVSDAVLLAKYAAGADDVIINFDHAPDGYIFEDE